MHYYFQCLVSFLDALLPFHLQSLFCIQYYCELLYMHSLETSILSWKFKLRSKYILLICFAFEYHMQGIFSHMGEMKS